VVELNLPAKVSSAGTSKPKVIFEGPSTERDHWARILSGFTKRVHKASFVKPICPLYSD